jgi:hypothetical protein
VRLTLFEATPSGEMRQDVAGVGSGIWVRRVDAIANLLT